MGQRLITFRVGKSVTLLQKRRNSVITMFLSKRVLVLCANFGQSLCAKRGLFHWKAV